jgi:serine/threonine-protein kinase HipA
MNEVSVLDVLLYGKPIGTLNRVSGDRTLFAFNEKYIADENRPTLGLAFKTNLGELITEFRPYQTHVMPFFSNLLPEGSMRDYLAGRAAVNPEREFFLLQALGEDLPGAITIQSSDRRNSHPKEDAEIHPNALRFSLAGVQLKFSAIANARGGLTIPTRGVGGSWIVKLPSQQFAGIPENEYSMMTLARIMGMDVPAVELISIQSIGNLPKDVATLKGKALSIQRFDRLPDGGRVHIEDFAQIFDVYAKQKYTKASYVNIASVLAAEGTDNDIAEFIRRLIFNTLIGNADMHLKNWSVVYQDRRTAALAPAYDFVSTIPYIRDEKAALNFSREKRFDALTDDELSHLAARAHISERLVLETARETVALFHRTWREQKAHLPLAVDVVKAIEAHMRTLPIARA